jgi:sialic acid synthase SpsE
MLVTETARAWRSIGAVKYGPTEAEQKSLIYRRSLYVAEPMMAGDVFTVRNLRVIRPGDGLHPRFYEQILGMRVARDVAKGTPVAWEMLTGRSY